MELTEEKLKYLEEVTPGNKAIYQIRGDRIAALYLSPSLHSIVGLSAGEFERIAKNNTADTVVPDDLPALMNSVRECIRTRQPMSRYWRVKHPEQGFIWVHASGVFCGEKGGDPVLLVTYGNDSNEVDLYKDVVDNSQSMAYVCDCSTHEILYANRAAREYGGHRQENLLGRTCYSYIHGKDSPCGDCFLKTLRRGEQLSRDRYNECRGRWEHLSGKYIDWCGRDAFIQYIVDITDSVTKQTELQNLAEDHRRQLEATQILNEQGPVEKRMNAALEIMREYYKADRAYVFMIDEGGKTLSNTYECCRGDVAPQIASLQGGDIHYIDRWMPSFDRQEVVIQEEIEEIRESNPDEYEIMSRQNIRSYIEAPIVINGKMIGFLGADNPPAEKIRYSSDLLLSFAYAAGNAIVREQNEQRIRKHSEELEAIVNNIPVGVSMLRVRDGRAVSKVENPLFRELFGVPDEQASQTDWIAMERIEEPYRSQVQEKMRALLVPGTTVSEEFPYLRDGPGQLRWYKMNSRSVALDSGLLYFSCLSDITDEKKSEAEKEKSRRMYEAAVEAANVAVWEYDIPNHRVIMAENNFTEYDYRKFGLPKIIENAPASLIPYIDERDAGRFLAMYDAIDHGAAKASCEVWYKLKPGREPRCEHITYTTVYGENGLPESALGIGVNVTARKQEEEKYRLFYQQMMEANPDTLGSFRLNLTKNRCGDGQCQDPEYLSLQHDGTADGFLRRMAERVEAGAPRESFCSFFTRGNLLNEFQKGCMQLAMEIPFVASPRNIRWGKASVSMVQNPMTGDVEAIAFTQDITRKKKQEEIAQRLTNEIIDYIGLINLAENTFEFANVNKRINALPVGKKLGYEICTEYDIRTFVAPDDRNKFRSMTAAEHITAELAESAEYAFTYSHRENGKILRKQLHYAYLNDSRREILVIQSDITETYRQEQEQMRRLREALQSAEKANAAKSDFLSRMSHDIRTPLNGIIGMTYIARREANPEKTEDCLAKIDTSSKFLLGLINDILDMSKAESGKIGLHLEPYPPEEFNAYMEAVVQPLVDGKHQTLTYEIHLPAGCVPVQDKLRINQIVFNILSNAVKFTPEGGKIRYTAEGEILPDGKMLLRIEVSDNGIGMSGEFQKILFDSFTQEGRNDNSSERGTGLGMAITKKLVDLMNGSIRVRSRLGQGTTFTLELPTDVVPDQEAGRTAKAEQILHGAGAELAGKHILLCEDHPLNQEIAEALLAEHGMEVSVAEDGKRGAEMFRNSLPGFYDAVLMDIRMPVMDGYKAAEQIRALNRPDAKTVPIIAMTADAFEDDVQKCRAAGMNGHIAKPIDPGNLYRTLSRAILKKESAG